MIALNRRGGSAPSEVANDDSNEYRGESEPLAAERLSRLLPLLQRRRSGGPGECSRDSGRTRTKRLLLTHYRVFHRSRLVTPLSPFLSVFILNFRHERNRGGRIRVERRRTRNHPRGSVDRRRHDLAFSRAAAGPGSDLGNDMFMFAVHPHV